MNGEGRRAAALACAGLVLGFTLSSAGFGDWAEVHRMLSFGAMRGGGPSLDDLRLVLAFGGAVAIAAVGFAVTARRDAIPRRPLTGATVPGALLFGAGWAITGCCPAVALVQLGEGRIVAGGVTLCGLLAGLRAGRRLKQRLGIHAGSCGG